MLSLRMILFSIAAGICLWGLFNLLDNLKQPKLLRTPKVIVVKGCEPAESAEAVRLCPQLYCQKALLEAKVLPLQARFTVTLDRTSQATHPSVHLIAGTVGSGAPGGGPQFACLLDKHRVIAHRLLAAGELAGLAQQSSGWTL